MIDQELKEILNDPDYDKDSLYWGLLELLEYKIDFFKAQGNFEKVNATMEIYETMKNCYKGY